MQQVNGIMCELLQMKKIKVIWSDLDDVLYYTFYNIRESKVFDNCSLMLYSDKAVVTFPSGT